MTGYSKYVSLGLVSLLAACGGGGEFPALPSPGTLSVADADLALQSLSLDGDVVGLDTVTKSETQAQWDAGQTLRYVALLDNGDSVGVPLSVIPTDVQFTARGSAQAVIIDRQSRYALRGGDVAAQIANDGQSLTVKLSWASGEIDTVNAALPETVTVSLNSSAQGAPSCGAANLFCAGQIDVVANGNTVLGGGNMASDQFRAGVYGATAADAELAGRISYVDPMNLSVIGGFVAARN